MDKFFTSLFTTRSGVSSMRWVFLWTYLFATVVPLGSWALVYIRNNGAADMPAGVVTMVTLIIGAVTAGKVTQSFGENRGKTDVRPAQPAAES